MPLHPLVAENASALQNQVTAFRRTLLAWLGGLGVLLILLLLGVLRWSMAPLREVAADLARVERGDQETHLLLEDGDNAEVLVFDLAA